MIEKAMKDVHFSLKPNRNTKQQALEVIGMLKKVMPIERAEMRLKITSSKEGKKLKEKLSKIGANVETEEWMVARSFWYVWLTLVSIARLMTLSKGKRKVK